MARLPPLPAPRPRTRPVSPCQQWWSASATPATLPHQLLLSSLPLFPTSSPARSPSTTLEAPSPPRLASPPFRNRLLELNASARSLAPAPVKDQPPERAHSAPRPLPPPPLPLRSTRTSEVAHEEFPLPPACAEARASQGRGSSTRSRGSRWRTRRRRATRSRPPRRRPAPLSRLRRNSRRRALQIVYSRESRRLEVSRVLGRAGLPFELASCVNSYPPRGDLFVPLPCAS